MAQVLPAQGDERVVAAKANGIVTLTANGLTEGKAVSSGQALMTIESSGMADDNLRVRYQEAESAYRLAKAEYERKQSLAADRIVSESDLQRAQGEYERAEATYRNLRSNFSSGRQTATASISGYVKQLHRHQRTICGGRTATRHYHPEPQPANPCRGAAPLLRGIGQHRHRHHQARAANTDA